MDPQFQELASQIADAVEKRLSSAIEKRLNSHLETLDERIKTHIDQFEQRRSGTFEARTKARLETLGERIKTHIDQFEQRAELRMQMHFENLESRVTTAAEGFGATLQKIERDLSDLNKKVDTKFRDNDFVLSNHNRRITKLEKRR
jgi:uncharacterized protein Yka (UPF0111/DUF47 family)